MPKEKSQKKNHQQNKLHIYKKNDIVKTPKYFYDELDRIFHFDFDPCPVDPNFDGLAIENWGQMNYVNPPFSEIGKWLKKAVEQKKKGRNSVFLITLRPNNKYWLDYVFPYSTQIYLISKGIIFQDYKRELPIPLCLVLFDGTQTKETETNNTRDTERTMDDGSFTHCKTPIVEQGSEATSKGEQNLPILIKMCVQGYGREYDQLLRP